MSGQIPQLTGIRAPAFMMVFFAHAGYKGFFLWSAVDLYFVLSGFLITRILLAQQKNDGFFLNFYSRRFLRIFPPFYVVLVLSLLALGSVTMAHALSVAVFASNIYMPLSDLSNVGPSYWVMGPYWTLAVEEQFYLLWPLLVFKSSPQRLLKICFCLILTAPVLRGLGHFYLAPWTNSQWLFMLPWNRMDLLASGAALAIVQHLDLFEKSRMSRMGIQLMAISAALIVGSVLLDPDFRQRGQDFYFSTMGLTYFCLLMSGLIMYLANTSTGWFIRLLSLKPITYLGLISYTMYLVHGPVLHISHFYFATAPRGIWIVCAYIITALIAALSWQLMEKPIQRLKNSRVLIRAPSA